MKHDTYHEETGLSGHFSGREKQDVFPAAPWMGARRAGKYPLNPVCESIETLSFMNNPG
jgi:hypothetical protein